MSDWALDRSDNINNTNYNNWKDCYMNHHQSIARGIQNSVSSNV